MLVALCAGLLIADVAGATAITADKADADMLASTSGPFISPPHVQGQLNQLNRSVEKMEQVISFANESGCRMLVSARKVSHAIKTKAEHIQQAVEDASKTSQGHTPMGQLLEMVHAWVQNSLPAATSKFDSEISATCSNLGVALLKAKSGFMDHYHTSRHMLQEAVENAARNAADRPAQSKASHFGDPVSWFRGLMHPEQHQDAVERSVAVVESVDVELTKMAHTVEDLEELSRAAVETSVVEVITGALHELQYSCKKDTQPFLEMLPIQLAAVAQNGCNQARTDGFTSAAEAFEEELPTQVKKVKKLVNGASASVSALREYWRAVQQDGAIQDRATRLRKGNIGHK